MKYNFRPKNTYFNNLGNLNTNLIMGNIKDVFNFLGCGDGYFDHVLKMI